jgi:hypothetical protein
MVVASVSCGLVNGVFWSVLFALSPVAASEGISYRASLAVGIMILPAALLSHQTIAFILCKLKLLSVTIGAIILACGLSLGILTFSVYNLQLAPFFFSALACCSAFSFFLLAPSIPWLSQEHAGLTCYPISPAVSESISNSIVASLGMLVPILSVASGGRAVIFMSKGVEHAQAAIWVWFSICIVSAIVVAVFVRDAASEHVTDSKPYLLRHIIDRLRKDLRCVHLEGAIAIRAEPDPAPRTSTAAPCCSTVPVTFQKAESFNNRVEELNSAMARAAAAVAAAPVEDLSVPTAASRTSSPVQRTLLAPPAASFGAPAAFNNLTEELQSTSSEASAPDFRIPCAAMHTLSSNRGPKDEAVKPTFSKARPGGAAHPLPRTTSIGSDDRGIFFLHFCVRFNILTLCLQFTASPSVSRPRMTLIALVAFQALANVQLEISAMRIRCSHRLVRRPETLLSLIQATVLEAERAAPAYTTSFCLQELTRCWGSFQRRFLGRTHTPEVDLRF